MRGCRPVQADLKKAHRRFEQREPRDFIYRASTELVENVLAGTSDLTMGQAIAVLLQIWNRVYYSGKGRHLSKKHIDGLDAVVGACPEITSIYRNKALETATDNEFKYAEKAFNRFEHIAGHVGAAKALHLLAPRFFPLWDTAIAWAYGVSFIKDVRTGSQYVDFIRETREQVISLGGESKAGKDVVKLLDEYNYMICTVDERAKKHKANQ
jgi:hypothetical protein